MPKTNTFAKTERLCGKMRIQNLYAAGKRFVVWPLRVTFLAEQDSTSSEKDYMTNNLAVPEVLIWAPKALFKHAVDRNLLRRRMREAYRLNKQPLMGKTMQVAFNYIDKSIQPYSVIEKAMRKAVKRLQNE